MTWPWWRILKLSPSLLRSSWSLQPERVSNPVEDLDLGACGDLVVEGEGGFDDEGALGAGREEGVELG